MSEGAVGGRRLVACGTCRDTYSVEAGRDGIGQMTYDPCPDCTEPLLMHGHDTTGDEMSKDLWRSRLAPFDEAYSAFVQASWDQVNAMSDADLDQILLDVEQPSQTNCSWTLYRAARMVREQALTVREMRKTGRLAPSA